MVAFLGVCWWAFSPKRKKQFDEAAKLPFADDVAEEQVSEAKADELNEHKASSKDDEER